MQLILYSKPGCHLCEGLLEKLEQVTTPKIEAVEVRDITTQPEWFQRYQYEIPVLCYQTPDGREVPLPRLSPRAPVSRLADLLSKALNADAV